MRRFRIIDSIAAIAIFAALSTAGCGGGGGGSLPSSPGGDSRAFVPNYAATGQPLYNWGSMPVKIAFNGSTTHQGVDLKAVALAGIDEWSQKTGGVIRYSVTGVSQAGIVITFVKVANRPGSGQLVGLTNVSYSGGRQTHADVALHIWDGMTEGEMLHGLKGTATHEFGHALGIHAHSPYAGDAMYYAHGIEQESPLTERDVNTVKSHYSWLFTASRALPGGDPLTSIGAAQTVTIRCPAH